MWCTPVSPASDWFIIFCSQIRCLALSDPISSIQHRFSVLYVTKHIIHIRFYSLHINKLKYKKNNFSIWKQKNWRFFCGRKSQLVLSNQILTNPCLSLAVTFCGFISHLIGHGTINIPEIFSGVHSFMGKTVTTKESFRKNLTRNGSEIHSSWCQ